VAPMSLIAGDAGRGRYRIQTHAYGLLRGGNRVKRFFSSFEDKRTIFTIWADVEHTHVPDPDFYGSPVGEFRQVFGIATLLISTPELSEPYPVLLLKCRHIKSVSFNGLSSLCGAA